MYGIPNCDTVKKAIVWFNNHDIPFTFHDYKKEGITAAKLMQWCRAKGWEAVFNKRSSTWKEVMKAYEGLVNNAAEAIQIMQQHNSIIKRPVIEMNGTILIGYNETAYKMYLLKA